MSSINSGTILIAFVAVLFGLGGTYMIRKSMKAPPKVVAQAPVQRKSAPQRLTVPMASRDLAAGHQVSLDDVALVKLTREEIKSYDIRAAFMTNPDQIIGKTLREPLHRGKTFDTKIFYPQGRGPGIAERIKPGRRAVTVSLSATNALLGFAGAGQIVDVLFHYGENDEYVDDPMAGQVVNDQDRNLFNRNFRTASGANAQRSGNQSGYGNTPVGYRNAQATSIPRQYSGDTGQNQIRKYMSATKTLVQRAEILALGRETLPTNEAQGVPVTERVLVTLSVEPRDAEAIRVADGHGELSLSLRNNDDDEVVEPTKATKIENILDIEDKVVIALPPPPPLPPRRMEVYRGQRLTSMQFDPNGSLSRKIVDSPQAFDPAGLDNYDASQDSPWASSEQMHRVSNGLKRVSEVLIGDDPNQAERKSPVDQSDVEASNGLELNPNKLEAPLDSAYQPSTLDYYPPPNPTGGPLG